MMRSMYAGVAGLRTHQTRMDVIGNNISNVNTVGFKGSNVTFVDLFYQTTQSATGPNTQTGSSGINAKQIGLGSTVSSIYKNITEAGGTQTTNNPFDIMINGDTFFVVNNGGENFFTKNGAFTVDANGTLCTQNGANVMGWQVDPNDPSKCVADEVSALRIMSPENLFAPPEATTQAYVTGNLDMKDTQLQDATGKAVQISFYDNMGYSYTAKFAVKQSSGEEGSTNRYGVYLKDIVDANNKSIFKKEIKDEDGNITYEASGQTLKYKQVLPAGAEGDGGELDYTLPEIDPVTGEFIPTADELPLFSVIFDGNDGVFKGVSMGEGTDDNFSKSVSIAIGDISPNPFSPLEIDWSKLTMFSTSEASSLEGHMGTAEDATIGAGKKVGNMTETSIDKSGKIYGSYDNGTLKLLGQIAVASFSNPSGLEAVGESLFRQTQNSGLFNGIGEDPTKNGSLATGVLEMSNVDLSGQFTDMITTQRGFQANSRIITVSDTLLEELINLKR